MARGTQVWGGLGYRAGDRTNLSLGSHEAPQSRSRRPVALRVPPVPALDGDSSQVHLLDEPVGTGREAQHCPGCSRAQKASPQHPTPQQVHWEWPFPSVKSHRSSSHLLALSSCPSPHLSASSSVTSLLRGALLPLLLLLLLLLWVMMLLLEKFF